MARRKNTIQRDASGRALREHLGYIDERATAGIIGITVPTLRNRQAAGAAPPHYKIGREKLFRLDEVDAWIRRARRG